MDITMDSGVNRVDDREIFNNAHAKAKDEAKQYIDFQAVMDSLLADKEEGVEYEEFLKNFEPAVQAYIKEFGLNMGRDHLKNAGNKDVRELADTDFPEKLAQCALTISTLVAAFFKGDISQLELFRQLGEVGIGDLGIIFISKMGVTPESLADVTPGNLLKLSAPALAYIGFLSAYKELMKALEAEAVAEDQRINVERQCAEAVDNILKCRAEMEAVVSHYMYEHLDAINIGFAAMDQAIVDNDVDGYIYGNAKIQAILGYEIQFTNQEEFNVLMDSDTPFKL